MAACHQTPDDSNSALLIRCLQLQQPENQPHKIQLHRFCNIYIANRLPCANACNLAVTNTDMHRVLVDVVDLCFVFFIAEKNIRKMR